MNVKNNTLLHEKTYYFNKFNYYCYRICFGIGLNTFKIRQKMIYLNILNILICILYMYLDILKDEGREVWFR